ncbi:putative Ig domain-containing protein [Tropheryma whipplei]|uniref:putative Ig domain-containing protein n=1 Tax=Tropheryma whipplei TaxID=2039 RepID=UPI003B985468
MVYLKDNSIDTTKGTITGSIDTGVTPGEYVATITVTYSNASTSKTEVSPVLPSNSVNELVSPNRSNPYPQVTCNHYSATGTRLCYVTCNLLPPAVSHL